MGLRIFILLKALPNHCRFGGECHLLVRQLLASSFFQCYAILLKSYVPQQSRSSSYSYHDSPFFFYFTETILAPLVFKMLDIVPFCLKFSNFNPLIVELLMPANTISTFSQLLFFEFCFYICLARTNMWDQKRIYKD